MILYIREERFETRYATHDMYGFEYTFTHGEQLFDFKYKYAKAPSWVQPL